jgi:hypothetical protein
MPLDHYVSQVHLKNFYSTAPPHLLFAIRKSDLDTFRCDSRSVCRTEQGSTNNYLTNERAIEEFLLNIEPNYNASLTKLRNNRIDQPCVYSIAGFVAYVSTCAPASMRINSGPLRSDLEATGKILDRQGEIPQAPPELGSKSLTELLEDGTVKFKIDGKFPQAMGINAIHYFQSVFGNSIWEVLDNAHTDSPFLTSDFPIAIEANGNTGIVNRIIPLAPDLALRIIPDISLRGTTPDLSFAKLRHAARTPSRREITELNRIIVRCAEDIVFYHNNFDWIFDFVKKNRNYRIEAVTHQIPHRSGILNVSSQRVVPFQQDG